MHNFHANRAWTTISYINIALAFKQVNIVFIVHPPP